MPWPQTKKKQPTKQKKVTVTSAGRVKSIESFHSSHFIRAYSLSAIRWEVKGVHELPN